MESTASIRYMSPVQSAELVLRLTRKMLLSADQQDWVATQSIEEERNQVLQNLFNHPEFDLLLPSIATILYQVMDYDAQVIEQGEAQLRHMSQEMLKSVQSRRAVNAYLDSMA